MYIFSHDASLKLPDFLFSGASIVTIFLHASFFGNAAAASETEELTMEEIVVQ